VPAATLEATLRRRHVEERHAELEQRRRWHSHSEEELDRSTDERLHELAEDSGRSDSGREEYRSHNRLWEDSGSGSTST